MDSSLKASVIGVINPGTGKSLIEEGRIIDLYVDDKGNLKINYLSNNLKLEEKRIIEQNLISAVQGKFAVNQIIIQSQSQIAIKKPVNKKEETKVSDPGRGFGSGPASLANVKKIIAISSAKGGVGKSTITSNLSLALAHQGFKVGLLDADIYGPSIPLIMGVENYSPVINDDKKLVPARKHGVDIVSFGFFISKHDPVIWRGPMLSNVLKQLVFDVEWGELDILLIDFPPGTGDVQLSLAQTLKIDGAVMVSTPQQVAIQDTIKGKNMFDKLNIPIIGMVENMAFFICDSCSKEHHIFGKDSIAIACQEINIEHLGSIPLYSPISTYADSGNPLMAIHNEKHSAAWNSYMHISKKIITYVHKKEV